MWRMQKTIHAKVGSVVIVKENVLIVSGDGDPAGNAPCAIACSMVRTAYDITPPRADVSESERAWLAKPNTP